MIRHRQSHSLFPCRLWRGVWPEGIIKAGTWLNEGKSKNQKLQQSQWLSKIPLFFSHNLLFFFLALLLPLSCFWEPSKEVPCFKTIELISNHAKNKVSSFWQLTDSPQSWVYASSCYDVLHKLTLSSFSTSCSLAWSLAYFSKAVSFFALNIFTNTKEKWKSLTIFTVPKNHSGDEYMLDSF